MDNLLGIDAITNTHTHIPRLQEPATKPQILPLAAERRPLQIDNSDAWAAFSAPADEPDAPPPGTGGGGAGRAGRWQGESPGRVGV